MCHTGCYASDEHGRLLSTAYALIGLWPVGVLILYASLLYATRKSIRMRKPNRLMRSIEFLHRDYRPEVRHAASIPTPVAVHPYPPTHLLSVAPMQFYYWELVELARRTILNGWLLLIDERHTFVRILVATLVCLGMLVLTLTIRPYRYHEDQLLASCGHFMVLVSFAGASYVKAYGEVREKSAETARPNIAEEVFGFDSVDHIFSVLFIFTVAMLALQLGTLMYDAAKDAHVATIRLKGTRKPPELTLQKHEFYHLFISRKRATPRCIPCECHFFA